VLDGQLPPEDGALLRTALHALSAPLPGEPRSPRQRRADALSELARRTLHASTVPDAGGERPHVTVTVDLPTLQAQPASRAAELDRPDRRRDRPPPRRRRRHHPRHHQRPQ
jgi:uncharacterized membrane protein